MVLENWVQVPQRLSVVNGNHRAYPFPKKQETKEMLDFDHISFISFVLWCTIQVAPLEYLRHVTMDIGRLEPPAGDLIQPTLGVNALIDRFNEVNSPNFYSFSNSN